MDASWPERDLREVVEIALERGGHLLTAGEGVVARRWLALPAQAATLYARLSARVGPAFVIDELDYADVGDVRQAVATLCEHDLASTLVSASDAARSCTVALLKQTCRTLSLSVSGRKDALVARLSGHRRWWPPLVQLRHLGLLRRLEQWRFLRTHPDRSTLVAERLGHLRWPSYAVTTGPRLFADRRALLRWEEAVASLCQEQPWVWLAALEERHRWPPPLSVARRLARRVRHAARELEQAGELEASLALLDGLQARGVPPWTLAVRRARCLERLQRPVEALEVLRNARAPDHAVERVAIERAGRRTARSMARGWAPRRPLGKAPERTLRVCVLPADGPRPRLATAHAAGCAEEVVVGHLAALGRRALHVEGALWRALFALVFAPAYFAPVPGALPSRFLDGPLDLGTPDFARRRHAVVEGCWREMERAPGAVVRRAHAQWSDTHLAGVRWSVAPVDVLSEVAESLGARGLRAILTPLLHEGPRAGRGMPDLVILPGEPVRVHSAFPSRLGPGLLLAEVKGPTDHLQDTQRIWHHRLRQAQVPVEVWKLVT